MTIKTYIHSKHLSISKRIFVNDQILSLIIQHKFKKKNNKP